MERHPEDALDWAATTTPSLPDKTKQRAQTVTVPTTKPCQNCAAAGRRNHLVQIAGPFGATICPHCDPHNLPSAA